MKFSRAALATAIAATTSAAPLETRAQNIDGVILNYALTLEHLENAFYASGLKSFTKDQFAQAGYGGSFYTNLQTIAADEATHVAFLKGGLEAAGVAAVAPCSYNFPYTSPKAFVGLASILEGVGVSAYLGAAQFITSKDYLTYAGSILTVEARHSAFIRNKLGLIPFASPFDTPLDFNEVYTLAAAFITSCPDTNPALPVSAFPSLSILNATSPLVAGNQIYLITPDGTTLTKNTYAAWASFTGPIFTEVTLSSNKQSAWTTIPPGVTGQSYVVLTKNNKNSNDNNIQAGPAIVEIADASS